IAHIHLHTSEPLPLDPYTTSRHTGSFLLIDPTDGTTLTAGMAGRAFAEGEPENTADDGWDF
ncbi:hypothetical protein ACFP1Z_30140, partial [Streptomyces gamaensis]